MFDLIRKLLDTESTMKLKPAKLCRDKNGWSYKGHHIEKRHRIEKKERTFPSNSVSYHLIHKDSGEEIASSDDLAPLTDLRYEIATLEVKGYKFYPCLTKSPVIGSRSSSTS